MENQEREWVIFEAVGHVKVAGWYEFRDGLHWVWIPDPEDLELFQVQKYGTAAVYRITPATEQTARRLARQVDLSSLIPWDLYRQIKAEVLAEMKTIPALTEGENDPTVNAEHYDDPDFDWDEDSDYEPD